MIRNSFPLRVLAVCFLVLALPLLIDSFLFFKSAYDVSVSDAKVELKELADSNAFSITELTPIKQVLLKELEVLLGLDEIENGISQEKLNEELKVISQVAEHLEVFILGLSKNERFRILSSSVPERVGGTLMSFHQLPEIEKKGFGAFWRYAYFSEERSYFPYVFLGKVLYSKDKKIPLGILLVVANVEAQLEKILEKDVFGKQDVYYALADQDGIIFASTDPKLKGEFFFPLSTQRRKEVLETHQLGTTPIAEKPLSVVSGEEGSPFFEFLFEDHVYGAYQTDIPSVGITMIAYSSKQEIFGQSIRHFLLIYTIFALIFLIGGGVTYWLTLWMGRPLRQLSQVMEKVKEGSLNQRFHEEPLGFELNLLGSIFNHTLDSLLETMQKAEDEQVQKETLKKEIEIGREVQLNLLPSKMPVIEGVDLGTAYLPAREAGGDFYDIFDKDEELFLTIADTSGRGISTCLYSLGVRSLLRTQITLTSDLQEIAGETNRLFCKDTGATGVFSTLFVGKYDKKSQRLSYISCGHLPAIIRKGSGELILLEATSMALGLSDTTTFHSKEVTLEPGDLLLLYTDGLVEATNEKHQMFSLLRLKGLLQQRQWREAGEVVKGITEQMVRYQAGTPQDEEIALLVMRVTDDRR